MNSTLKAFRKICLTTLVATYFLIAVGAVVRATGSGMGCPDWPKCFGQWMPPTSVEQLPKDYKESYSALREKKNARFVRYLKVLGMGATATKIESDPSILVEADFNATKTWIEYLNRLVGIVIGFLIVLLFYQSIRFRKSKPVLFWVSFATLVAVLFQGWFGSIVVSTNLTTWTITVHMFVALVMVSMLNYLLAVSSSSPSDSKIPPSITWILVACSVVLLIQIFLGTQVREVIDRLASVARGSWISSLGVEFVIHRSFSWLVVGLHVLLLWKLQKTSAHKTLTRTLFVLILSSFFTGVGMAYLNVPALLQPLHLVLASISFGLQQYLLFGVSNKRNVVVE